MQTKSQSVVSPKRPLGLKPGHSATRSSSASDQLSAGVTATILLVEDEPSIRQLITIALEDAGYRVIEARHGAEAAQLFDQHGPDIDLLLTDMRMPYVGGAELVAQLRGRRRTLKCLVISAYAVDPEMTEPLLPKPFTRPDLLATVRRVLSS